MKIKVLTSKFEISRSFETALGQFITKEISPFNENIGYITIALVMCSGLKESQSETDSYLFVERVGLSFNYEGSYILVTLYWRHIDSNVLVYPDEEILPNSLEFWIEGITDHLKSWIKERFKVKPQPNLIKGYAFSVESWKWDGVDALLEVTTQKKYLDAIGMKIHEAAAAWNALFEEGKKKSPIHSVGEFEQLEEGVFEIHVNTGYSGLSALKYILKALDKTKLPIEKIAF